MHSNPIFQHKDIWYSASGKKFDGREPFFYDLNAPWVDMLETEWLVIRDELNSLLQTQANCLTPYFDKTMISKPELWKVFPFFFWKRKFTENCQKCPRTTKLLESIPHMVSGSFSLLEANSTIEPHSGDTNAIVRCHLGLKVPAFLPNCGLRVGNEEKSWTEGKFLMFCDAHKHAAWNHTSEKRFIMIVDVMCSQYISRTNEICNNVFSHLFKKRIQMLLK